VNSHEARDAVRRPDRHTRPEPQIPVVTTQANTCRHHASRRPDRQL